MKILLLICLATALCFSCKNSKTGKTGSSDLKDSVFVYNDRFIKIESITKDDFEKYPKCEYDKDYNKSDIIESHNDTLRFVIDSVKTVVFTDTLKNSDSDGIRVNKHIGDLLDYHIITTGYYETAGWTIVNKINGAEYNLVSDPYLSPKHKYIVSFGGSLEYIVPPVYQVWSIKKDMLIKKIELETLEKGFSIEEIRWITDDRQAVKIGFGTGQQAYGILSLK